jgi:uncharacterized alkaline shock family protein YloU
MRRETAERGALTIADRVLEKIASVAASEVAHVAGPRHLIVRRSRRATGPGTPGGGRRPRASVHVGGREVRVRLALSVDYPEPVDQVCKQVRSRVAARLWELAGARLTRVDVDVATLTSKRGRTIRAR